MTKPLVFVNDNSEPRLRHHLEEKIQWKLGQKEEGMRENEGGRDGGVEKSGSGNREVLSCFFIKPLTKQKGGQRECPSQSKAHLATRREV